MKPVSFDRGVIPLGTYSSILTEGYAANWDTSNLFRILNIISRKGKSHIVLTSSIIPIELKNRQSSIKIVRIKGICLEEVKTVFGDLIDRKWANKIPRSENLKSREIIGEIFTSLNGHAYLLTLLFHALSGFELTQDPRQWLSKLSNELSATVPERRANLVVEASIWIVTKDNINDASLAIEILEHLSMFTTPVDINAIMKTCAKGEYTIQKVEKYVAQLEKANLVFKVCPLPNEPNSLVRYSIHSIIRRYNRYKFGNLADSPAEPNLIDLSNLETKPDKDHVYTPYATSTIGIAIDKLIAEIYSSKIEGNSIELKNLCRGAFGLIRASWSAQGLISVPYMPDKKQSNIGLEGYQYNLVRLLNLVRSGEPHYKWRNVTDSKIVNAHGILYADELAWLYNELGLAAYYQGYLHDAYPFFISAKKINCYIEKTDKGDRRIQSEINLALVQLERGRFPRARQHLESAFWLGRRNMRPAIEGRIKACRGLLYHLSANYIKAEQQYTAAIDVLAAAEDLRNLSIFLRHRADLRRKFGKIDDGKEDLLNSRAAATAGGHLDLVHYLRAAEAFLSLTDGEMVDPEGLNPSIGYARQTQLPKLLADLYQVQAIIALHQKDISRASKAAIKALNISLNGGMRLRVAVSLMTVGRICRARGDRAAAGRIFKVTRKFAERQGYQHQIQEAEREILTLA